MKSLKFELLIIAVLLAALFFISGCNKESVAINSQQQISFTLNDSSYSFSGNYNAEQSVGVWCTKRKDVVSGEYLYSFQGWRSINDFIDIQFEADSLQCVEYDLTYSNSQVSFVNSSDEFGLIAGQRFVFTVDKIEGNKINAEFSGYLLELNGKGINFVSNGILNNIILNN